MIKKQKWTLADIPWDQFDKSLVTPELIELVKTAAVVEENSKSYAYYLKNVFPDDKNFHVEIERWADEEEQHGRALAKWAEMADPTFNYDKAFAEFKSGYKVPIDVRESVRGSKTGELLARCVVEAGTSSYYTAIKDSTDEPVLREICRNIAADEFKHYKLFYDFGKRYQLTEKLGLFKRLKTVYERVAEVDDDELSYAYYATNVNDGNYRSEHYQRLYFFKAHQLYKRTHLDRAGAMILKACGLRPRGWIHRIAMSSFWSLLSKRLRASEKYLNDIQIN